MNQLDAMRIFQRVVETGSFSAVARERKLAQPTISKQIAALEQHLGAQLLRRTPRALKLTDAGQDYYEAVARLLADLEAAESRVAERQAVASGMLRVALSSGFGRMCLVPLLPDFLARYPQISLDIVVGSRSADLIENGLDLAIRIGDLNDSSLIRRRIGFSSRVAVASRDYLERRGAPLSPFDLAHHECITCASVDSTQDWRFEGPGSPIVITPSGRLKINDPTNVRQAVLAGLGIAYSPTWLFSDKIDSGEVTVLLERWRPAPEPISAIYPPSRQSSTKIRVFVDFLAEALGRQHWFSARKPVRRPP